MASITAAAQRVKDELTTWISEARVRQACAAAGHAWRDRRLPPWVVLRLFAWQVMAGNVACRAVARWSERAVTAQAYCAARLNLPLDVLGDLAAELTHEAQQRTTDFGRWLGHRVFHLDGTGLSMPDEPALQQAFGQPGGMKPGCGFPVMHVLWLFDAATDLIGDFIADKGNTHDMAHAAALHAPMHEGDVLVGDRAFGTFAHLALLLQAKLHGVFRAHQRQIVDFTPRRKHRRQRRRSQRKGTPTSRWLRGLGPKDQIVQYVKPPDKPHWMSQEEYEPLPARLPVRELEYRLARPGFRTKIVTLVTTLLDGRKYPQQALAELYHARWQIETNLRHLKQTMGMDVLRCKTVEGVKKELWMYLIVYNQVRLFMLDAAERQGVPPDRISFIDALEALREYGPLLAAMLRLVVHPRRPGRHEPRVIKRKKDRYTYMTRPRDELRKALGITRLVA